MKNLELFEGFFDKKKGDSLMDFLDSIKKQADDFVKKVKAQALKENERDAKTKKYNDTAKKSFEKIYLNQAAKIIKEAAGNLK